MGVFSICMFEPVSLFALLFHPRFGPYYTGAHFPQTHQNGAEPQGEAKRSSRVISSESASNCDRAFFAGFRQ